MVEEGGEAAAAGIIEQLRQTLETEDKARLELHYGVIIPPQSLIFTSEIVCTYFDRISSQGGEGEIKNVGELSLPMMRMKAAAVTLLEKACAFVREDLNGSVDEMQKSWITYEYVVRRNCVELHEMTKEKDKSPYSRLWVSFLNIEWRSNAATLTDFWSKWSEHLLLASSKADEQISRLSELRLWLESCMQEDKASEFTCSSLLEVFHKLMVETHPLFSQHMLVSINHIAKVASLSTGVPASWLLQSSRPPLEVLKPRLLRRHFDRKRTVNAICNALLRTEHAQCHPLGSFIFFGCSDGQLKVVQDLAELLFDDRNLLMQFDMSEYTDSDSLSRLIGAQSRPDEQDVVGRLPQAVVERPFCVLLFNKLEMAHDTVVDALIDILEGSTLLYFQGKIVDFRNTLIIMNLTFGANRQNLTCECPFKDQDLPFKADLDSIRMNKHWWDCAYMHAMKEVKHLCKPKLLDLVNDIVCFFTLCEAQWQAAFRLQLRDIAHTQVQRGSVLYASEAALSVIAKCLFRQEVHGKATRDWLEEHVIRVLLDLNINDTNIYIDTLAGTKDLSYRQSICSPGDKAFKKFQGNLNRLRNMYRKEKEQANRIYGLITSILCSNSPLLNPKVDTDVSCKIKKLQEMIGTLSDLVSGAAEIKLEADKYIISGSDLDLSSVERSPKRPKQGVDGLPSRLHNLMTEQSQAFNVVAKAFLRAIDEHGDQASPVMSFLLLGLSTSSKWDLVQSLTGHLVADDGGELLYRIDMSECTNSESLLCLMDRLSRLSSVRPYNVLFIDQVEKAHMSVFSALISVLDHGILTDVQGMTVDVRNSVIIIASDLGNTEIFAQFFGHSLPNAFDEEYIEGCSRFRLELIYRVDEIVFFDPCVDEQLKRVARLSQKDVNFKTGYLGISEAFMYMFKAANDPVFRGRPCCLVLPAIKFMEKLQYDDDSTCGSPELYN